MALSTRTRRFVPAAAFMVLLIAPAFALAGEPLAVEELVVPGGQDELLATMLGRGAKLPDGCKFSGGTAEGPIIRSTYTCPSGEVVCHLVHRDNATATATQTERFAIMVESGAPPRALVEALAALVRADEADFEWMWFGPEDEDAPESDAGDEGDPLPNDPSW